MGRGGTNPAQQLCAGPALPRGPISIPFWNRASHGAAAVAAPGCRCGTAPGMLRDSSSGSASPKPSSHRVGLPSLSHGRGRAGFPLPRLPTPARVIYDPQVFKLNINQQRRGGGGKRGSHCVATTARGAISLQEGGRSQPAREELSCLAWGSHLHPPKYNRPGNKQELVFVSVHK